jgi:iron complex transport system substrate-binding protein
VTNQKGVIPQGGKVKYSKAMFAGVLAVLLSVGLLAGCSSGKSDSSAEKTASPATRTITDVYGRGVEIPGEVKTVATVGSAARFVVYAGGQDKLVAVTEMETTSSPARPYTKAYETLFAALPSTSNGNHLMETTVDTERMLTIKPDVIISSRSAQECDELQNAIGIPVVGVSYQDQLFSDDVYDSIAVTGEALGTEEHAEAVVEAIKGWEQDLQDRTASIADADKPTCYAGAVNYKGGKSFGGTYAHYAPFEAVNAINVADSTGQSGSVQVELEQLGEWNPDYMFLNAGNMDLMMKDYGSNAAFFDGLTAFKEGNLYSQPAFNFNGTNVEMGICDAYFIGSTIYPKRSRTWI